MNVYTLNGPLTLSLTLGETEAAQSTQWRRTAQPQTRQFAHLAPSGPILLDLVNTGAAGAVTIAQTDEAATAAQLAAGLPPTGSVLEASLPLASGSTLRQAINPIRRFVVLKPSDGITGRVTPLGLVQRGPSSLRLAPVVEVGDPPTLQILNPSYYPPSGPSGPGNPRLVVYGLQTETGAPAESALPTLARVEWTDQLLSKNGTPIDPPLVKTATAAVAAPGAYADAASWVGVIDWTAAPYYYGSGASDLTGRVTAVLEDAAGTVLLTVSWDWINGAY